MSSPRRLLIVTAGPARGRSVPLEGRVHIGRETDNALFIGDPALSRRHCVVEATDAHVVIKDLDSRNGVFVNGVPIKERQLADGDQIRIGDSALVVMVPADETVATRALADKRSLGTGTVTLSPDESAYLTGRRVGDLAGARSVSNLQHLFGLSKALHAARTVREVQSVLVTHAAAMFPDCAAALVTLPSRESEPAIVAQAPADVDFRVHADVLTQALDGHVAVLAADLPAVVVPLPAIEGDPAVLCVRGRDAQTSLKDDDLQVAAAICVIADLAIERASHIEWLEGETSQLRTDRSITHGLIGESHAMQSVYRFVSRVAPTDSTVLLRGESGTGKEVIAHALHSNSGRARGPFVAINCAALPEALLESELFGHERGAFTGALSQQRGRLETADRGTVFLDEIGELAPPLQAKLLRVLQDRTVERVGGRRPIKIDVRVIAATNRDLESAIADGAFRQDLFYRLNVVALTVPPLRERRDDIPLLASYFVRAHSMRCKRTVRGISVPARMMLVQHDWPGNVRELSNVIERAVVLGESDIIGPDDLPESFAEGSGSANGEARGYHGRVAAQKRAIIAEALDRNKGNVAAAARDLELQVTYLHRLIRTLGVR